MDKNKWRIEIKDSYTIGEQTITKSHLIAIPPTDGDRTDIIDENGRYHYGIKKSDFIGRISKEEYLEQTLPGLEGKEKEKALKEINWTPMRNDIGISIIIEIKQGEIFLKGK